MLTRSITALILLAVVALAVFSTAFQPYLIVLLLLAGAYAAAREWALMMPVNLSAPAFALGVTSISAVCLYFNEVWLGISLLGALIWMPASYWVKRYPLDPKQWFNSRLVLIGAALIVASATSAFALWQSSAWWLIYAMALVWVTDTGAYLFGRKWGKNKLAPNVSPNKTYEGMWGGLFLSAIYSLSIGLFVLELSGLLLIEFFALSYFCAYISVAGDLFESMIKREAGVKDSGTLLPGHGGVLDRIDAQLATLPIFYAGITFLMHPLISGF